jgi:hypothetical protein
LDGACACGGGGVRRRKKNMTSNVKAPIGKFK